MAIIADAPVQYASTAMAAGTSAQQVVTASPSQNPLLYPAAGNFCLQFPASNLSSGVPITVKAQGFIQRVVTGTISIALTWGKTAASQAVMYTAVASASLTGTTAPGAAFKWQVEQKLILDSVTQTADAFGPGSGNITAGSGNAWMWIGNAGVNIAAGYPPTQLTGVAFGPTQSLGQVNAGSLGNVSQPTPSTGLNQAALNAVPLFVGIQFTNGTSDPTGQFVIDSFYAVQD